nr:metabotropic glutamate receptor 2-like [Parasteatoda tepidariorum]
MTITFSLVILVLYYLLFTSYCWNFSKNNVLAENVAVSQYFVNVSFEENDTNFPSEILSLIRKSRTSSNFNQSWPVKRVSEIDGDIILGGLMMIHEREDQKICGPIMPQGGIQALECMLYTMDWVNNQKNFLPGIKLGAYVLDDCDKDTYGLEQAVDFIKGI